MLVQENKKDKLQKMVDDVTEKIVLEIIKQLHVAFV